MVLCILNLGKNSHFLILGKLIYHFLKGIKIIVLNKQSMDKR